MTARGHLSERTPLESAEAAEKWCAALPARYIGTPLTQEPVTLLLEMADAIKGLARDNEHAYHAYRELTEGRP